MQLRARQLTQLKLMWGEIKQFVAIAGVGMSDGEQTRDELCPACVGGKTREKAFSLHRRGPTIYFKCFRASCGINGRVEVYGSLVEPAEKASVVDQRRPFTSKLYSLDPDHLKFLCNKYSLFHDELNTLGVRSVPEDGRIAFEVRGPTPRITPRRGWNIRSFNPQLGYPKWDAYREAWEEPWMAWYERQFVMEDAPVIVVEDQISALKASRMAIGCALLGTSLDIDKVVEIGKKAGNRKVFLALDKDATANAIDFVAEFKFFTNNHFQTIPLDRDIKDMSQTDLLKLLKVYA